MLTIAVLMLALLDPSTTAPAMSADALAEAIMKASGAANWDKVKVIKFTFAGKNKHEWHVKDHIDKVTIDGKTIEVNVSHKPDKADKDKSQAYGRWTNDTYWLLAPLKVKDPGVIRSVQPDQAIDGKNYHVLRLTFDNVGLTPKNQYDLFVDSETHLVRHWDYYATPDAEPRRMSWDGYKNFGGLMLSTEHKSAKVSLMMSDVEVVTD